MSFTTPPNLVKFWNAVTKPNGIVKTGSEWVLCDGARWIGNLGSMIVRDCFVTLADRLLDDVTSISLLLGMKGIGKTVFLNYLIVRIIEKFRAKNEPIPDIVYTWKAEYDTIKRVLFSVGREATFVHFYAAPYYLSDSVDIADASLGTRLLLVVTSPYSNDYRKFTDRMTENSAGAYELYVPPWSFDEVLLLNPDLYEATFLFNVFGGGCARYLLPCGVVEYTMDDYIQENAKWFFGPEVEVERPNAWRHAMEIIRNRIINILTACGGTHLADIAAAASMFCNPHIILQDPDRSNYSYWYNSRFLKFLSGCVRDESQYPHLWDTYKGVVFGARGRDEGAAVIFESIGHKTLIGTKKPLFIATNLKGKAVMRRYRRVVLRSFYEMPRKLFRNVEDIKDLADGHHYGIPLCCDNLTPCCLVDAVIQPDILVKFTVLECHGKLSDEEKYQALRDQLRGAKDTHKLIFVVTPE